MKAIVALALGAVLLMPATASAAPVGWKTTLTTGLSGDEYLSSIVATGPRNAWAFGTRSSSAQERTDLLAYHWNGRSWSRTPVPGGYNGDEPVVDASTGTNAWALLPCVNEDQYKHCWKKRSQVLRWTGQKWRVAAKLPGSVFQLKVVSSHDVWAFGRGHLAMHFNGARWTRNKMPVGIVLQAAAVSPRNIWAIGRNSNTSKEKLLRYDGVRWRVVSRKGIVPSGAQITGISVRHGQIQLTGATGMDEGYCEGQCQGFVVRQAGSRWVRETPTRLKHWTPGPVVTDGRGGQWMRVTDERSGYSRRSLAYRSPAGRWKIFQIYREEGGRYGYLSALAAVPGSTTVWGLGAEDGRWDIDAYIARWS
jgi:hypothetical protein